jgi:hypothetical protein
MASFAAMPLSVLTAPRIDHIENSEDTGWEEEDADQESRDNTRSTLDTENASASLPEEEEHTPEEDFGAPLSQHQPSLQWEDTAFRVRDLEPDDSSFKALIPNSESQGTNWDDANIDDDDEEEDEGALYEAEDPAPTAAAAASKKKQQNAKLLPLDEIKEKFLSLLVTLAFSSSMFKNTAAEDTKEDGALFDPCSKRQRKSSAASFSRLRPPKRHVCFPSSSCDASNSSFPDMNPTCNFTHKTNNILGKHIRVTCSQCAQLVTNLVRFLV